MRKSLWEVPHSRDGLDMYRNMEWMTDGTGDFGFDSIANLRANQSLRHNGWVVVDTWTTVMSTDNQCGFYCEHPDGHYYTIGITNRNVKF